MVVNFTALQLFGAYNFGKVLKSANSHFTASYNISLYHDTKVAIYRYTQIVCIIAPLIDTYKFQAYIQNICLYVVIMEYIGNSDVRYTRYEYIS